MQKFDDDGLWNCPTLATDNAGPGPRQMWSGHVMKDITIFDNFLSDDMLCDTLKFFNPPKNSAGTIPQGNWYYKNSSLSLKERKKKQQNVFWAMSLTTFPLFTDIILKHLESKTGKRFELLDVYANGQTVGQDGTWHFDDPEPGSMYTFLLYMTSTPETINSTNCNFFGGYTKFKLNRMIVDVEPITNRGVLFKSKLIHVGLSPLYQNSLRVSIAYKLKEIV